MECIYRVLKKALILRWTYVFSFHLYRTILTIAHAYIETPFSKGNVVALVLLSRVADIILGNIVSVNDSTWRARNVGRHEQQPDDTREHKAANVMTRAHKIAEERVSNQDTRIHPSKQKSDSAINLDALGKLDKHTFLIEQESDRSLDPLRSNESYCIQEGLLYRHAKKNNSTDQLVVSKFSAGTGTERLP